jgi:DNA polymerase-3 subunit epsilon
MRQVILDTETTGLLVREGNRIIEIGCIELLNRRFSGRDFHRYVKPDRAVEPGALEVHGITDEFLADKPPFEAIAEEFLSFVEGAEVIIHNAAFDVEFLDEELKRLGLGRFTDRVAGVHDTLLQARELHPGRRNSLDALCERYEIDNRHRTLHGALLDAALLAEVYLAMTRGQDSLAIELEASSAESGRSSAPRQRGPLRVVRASDEEAAAHEAVLAGIAKESRGQCVWLEAPPQERGAAPAN